MLFTPHLIKLDPRGEAVSLQAPKVWGQSVHVVPRSDCTFRRMKLKGRGRPALMALELQVKQETSAPDTVIKVVRDTAGDGVGVWTFPRHVGFEGRYLPESLAYTPMDEGARLVECFQGVEGQVWQNKTLLASRWWPVQPSEREWALFLNASNVDVEASTTLQPAKLAWRTDTPVFEMSKDHLMWVFSPKRLAIGSAIIGLLFASFFGAKYIRYASSLSKMNAEISRVSESAQLVLSQRRQALSNIKFPIELQGIGDEGQIMTAIYAVSQSLKGQDLTLVSVNSNNAEIEITMSGVTDLSGPDIVTRLEAIPVFTNVNATFDFRDNLVVKANLEPFKAGQTMSVVQKQSEGG